MGKTVMAVIDSSQINQQKGSSANQLKIKNDWKKRFRRLSAPNLAETSATETATWIRNELKQAEYISYTNMDNSKINLDV